MASGFTSARQACMLSAAEKTELRARVLTGIRSLQQEYKEPFAFTRIFYQLRLAAGALFGVIFAAGGIVYGAESALPGDVLYPVKIEVNERLWGFTAVSYEAQAEWSVARATRRLQEMEQLVVAGRLNEKRRREVTARFEEQATQANADIARLKTEQKNAAVHTSSQLESSLRLHERTLMQVAQDRADIGSQLQVILETVREKAASVSEIRQEIEKELGVAREEGPTASAVFSESEDEEGVTDPEGGDGKTGSAAEESEEDLQLPEFEQEQYLKETATTTL